MRLSSTLIAGAAASLLLVFQCGARRSSPAEGARAASGVVHFNRWMESDDVLLSAPHRYEVRAAPGGELLFAAKEKGHGDDGETSWETSAGGVFSQNFYAVKVAERLQTRHAAAEEWADARKVIHSRRRVPPTADKTARGAQPAGQDARAEADGVVFRGRKYAKSGASWGKVAALVSPSQRWLAVFSYTSRKPLPPHLSTPGGFGLFGEPEAGDGDIFWDVYDTSDGARVLAGHAPFTDNAPSARFSGALWVEDRYLVVPLESSFDTCLLGVLPVN